METSCLNNENVADAFETLIEITYREKIKEKNIDGKEANNITISPEKKINSSNAYCYC